MEIANPAYFKHQLLHWSQSFNEVVFMDSNNYHQAYSTFDVVLAVEAFTSISTDHYHAFDDLHAYQNSSNDWLFGYLSYDLKNATEALTSLNFDGLQLPELFFFQPKKLFFLKDTVLEVHYLNLCAEELETDLEAILQFEVRDIDLALHNSRLSLPKGRNPITIQQRISEEAYYQKVSKLLEYIHQGKCYEANFCIEFFAEEAIINPLETYQKLNAISQPPFAVYLKNKDHYLLSASPERYLKKEGAKVITQPIKGTARRVLDPEMDERSKLELVQNTKERAENIMIVDLVRNDLSRTATKDSVQVEELCGIYTFKQVHQMISTVVAQVATTTSPVSILQSTFPMGSMTGAPKISAMQIIEELEATKRGLYSGAVGYFTPSGDFDFNVVIRSILYNAQNNYLSFSVGSAITAEASPEGEYQECLLKAKAMFEVLL